MGGPETRVALANLDTVARGSVLTVGFDPELAAALRDHPQVERVTAFDLDLRRHRANRMDGVEAAFGSWVTGGPFDGIVLALPKERERLRMLLAMARSVAALGAVVSVAGHNRAGVRSAPGDLAEWIGEPDAIDYRAHCRMYAAGATVAPSRATLQDWRAETAVEVAGGTVRIASYPGTFAHGRLDDGTRLLLESLSVPSGRAIDVGCGAGAIAAFAAARGAAVHAVDVDALAVASCAETLAANGLGGRVWASDVWSDVEGPYRAVLANTPFHAGIERSSEVAERLIAGAAPRLEPGGELWVVTNRFIDHGPRISASFGSFEVVNEDPRYRVYRARLAG